MGVTNYLLTGMIIQVGGGFKYFLFVSPLSLGKWSKLTHIILDGLKPPPSERVAYAPFQASWHDRKKIAKVIREKEKKESP